MKIELITKDDLTALKEELLSEIALMLNGKADHSKHYLRSKEVRSKLKVSAGTLVNMRIRGLLHPTKVAGVYYYSEEEIEMLLRGNAPT